MTLWVPEAKKNVAPVTSGSYTEGRWKYLVHTTEAYNFYPNPNKYYGHPGWPHFTIERDGTIWQHIDIDIAARALKNLAGGVQTNRSRVVQVENCAKSGDAKVLTDAQIESNRFLVRLLHEKRGMELRAKAPWTVPGSARFNAPQRMSQSDWRTYSGIVAHALAPENDHWDSGAFPLATLLEGSSPVIIKPEPQPEPIKEDFDMLKHGDENERVEQLVHLLNRVIVLTGGWHDLTKQLLTVRRKYDDEIAERVRHAIARAEQWVLHHPIYANSQNGTVVTNQTEAWLVNVCVALETGAFKVDGNKRVTIDDRFEPLEL